MIGMIISTLGNLVARFAAFFFVWKWARKDLENDQLKEQNKRLANRPSTNNDAVVRLRKWRDKLPRDGK